MHPAEKPILAFDTSGPWCSAALLNGPTLLDRRHAAMARGQAGALVPMLDALLADHHRGWHDIGAIAVGIGPGNFTGIRISVAAARGLALGLGIPAIGVSLFEVLAAQVAPDRRMLCSLEAPRGCACAQVLDRGEPQGTPCLIDPAAPPAGLLAGARVVIGHRAADIARALGAEAVAAVPEDPAAGIALIARQRLRAGARIGERPAPLYVRAADAAPPRAAPVPILP
ncbi:MAG: tRNA (adenosine(37)-N6)-threonylcarbamoyltransferase complex dimerization subunit type 1 TsaB [Rhodobacteraceae bacterium]|nr:tRNA (adenosine(37)-N6)-threonylcarbamoyltransferase complex dimerization subunit type 1 TsaB [Paracoccaceae bacterium]